jgi:hypothetical protein
MTYDDFVNTFHPIKNPLDKNAAFEGYMFETFGKEADLVRGCTGNRIWTIIVNDDCDELYVCNGYHIVNRIGYMLTRVPFSYSDTIEVLCD